MTVWELIGELLCSTNEPSAEVLLPNMEAVLRVEADVRDGKPVVLLNDYDEPADPNEGLPDYS